jgi:hypothetical protein
MPQSQSATPFSRFYIENRPDQSLAFFPRFYIEKSATPFLKILHSKSSTLDTVTRTTFFEDFTLKIVYTFFSRFYIEKSATPFLEILH